MCSRNYRKFRGQGRTAPGISVNSVSVCCDYELFAVVMVRITDEVRREPPWTMLLVDDVVICEETREEVEWKLECWRYALERRGTKVSRSKTEYLCVNGGNDKEAVKMEDAKCQE